MTRRAKITLWSILASAVVGGVLLAYLLLAGPSQGGPVSGDAAEIVEVGRITRREGIQISGNIEPVNAADLAFPEAGYIKGIYVHEGDTVSVGDILAVLEDSRQVYDVAVVQVDIDTELVSGTPRKAELLALQLEMVQEALDDTRLVSTIDGLVSQVNFEVGDYVTDLQAGSAADVVVRVIDRSAMIASVEVDELDAPDLKLDQTVEFQFDAYPDIEVFGKVYSIPLEARQTGEGIAVLDAQVIIDDPPGEILPSFTFSGEIFLSDEEEFLTIPAEAVINRNERTMVLRLVKKGEAGDSPPRGPQGILDLDLPEGFTVLPTPISIQDYSSGIYEVVDGLKPGDKVVVPPAITNDKADSSSGEDSKSVLDILGFSPPSRGGGGPPPGGN